MSRMTKLKSRKPESPTDKTSVQPLTTTTTKTKPNSIHEILEQMEVPAVKGGAGTGSKWRSVRQVYDDFCTETSFTALTRIHKATHVYKRICWLVLCLGMLAWLSVQCYWLFNKYYSYPVEVKIEIKAVPVLEFPSVTICNLNPLKASKLSNSKFAALTETFNLDDNDILYDDYLEELNEMMNNRSSEDNSTFNSMEYMQQNDFNRWKALENDSTLEQRFYSEMDDAFVSGMSYSFMALTIDDDELESYGHVKNDLILSCSWMGMSCSPKNFTYVRNNKYGNCYTFNSKDSGQAGLTTNYAGPMMGLMLELNIEQNDYIPGLTSDAGVRVTIHRRGTYPIPEDEGFSVPPGFQTSVGLSMTKLKRLPPPHADCGDSSEDVFNYYMNSFGVEYTKTTCLKSCYQAAIIGKCDCAFSLFYVPDGEEVCDYFSSNFSDCMQNSCQTVMEHCSTKCPTSCEEMKYEHSLSMSTWPSRQYSDHLTSKIQKINSDFMDEDERSKSSDTLLKLEVYFKELMYEYVEQQKGYESQNLISDIGGQLGLWLGLSAITIGEFFEFLATVFRLAANKVTSCNRRNSEAGHSITKVKPLEA